MLLGSSSGGFPLNWVVLLPVISGFLAVWYLLPAPRRRPLVNGVLALFVAVAGFATFLLDGLGDRLPFNVEGVLFVSFSLLAVTFAVLMIVQRNPARALLYFAVVVLSVCGLFLLLAAPFLMAATIIIYAGAIIVTFLFVIMLAQQNRQTDANDRSREPSLAAAVGFILLAALLVSLQRIGVRRDVEEVIQRSDHYSKAETVDEDLKQSDSAEGYLNQVKTVRDRLGYLRIKIPNVVEGENRREADSDPVEDMRNALGLTPPIYESAPGTQRRFNPNAEEVRRAAGQIHFELSYLKAVREGRISLEYPGVVLSPHGQSVTINPTDDPAKAEMRRLPSANIAALGRTLFTDHLLAIELGGTLLLVATIGAIAIAQGRSEKTV